jgi:DNA segregation ATPase FtsK/SpoIIIE-like protein
MITDHAVQQREMVARMESLVEQAKFQLKPIVKVTRQSRTAAPPKPVIDHEAIRRQQLEDDVARAIALVTEKGIASTSFLQRHMSVGYGRAARIMDELERRELITSQDGNRPRQLVR